MAQVIQDSQPGANGEQRPFYDFLESCLRHKAEMVIFEAARAICNMRDVTARELSPAITVLQLFLSSSKPVLRFAAVRTLNKASGQCGTWEWSLSRGWGGSSCQHAEQRKGGVGELQFCGVLFTSVKVKAAAGGGLGTSTLGLRCCLMQCALGAPGCDHAYQLPQPPTTFVKAGPSWYWQAVPLPLHLKALAPCVLLPAGGHDAPPVSDCLQH